MSNFTNSLMGSGVPAVTAQAIEDNLDTTGVINGMYVDKGPSALLTGNVTVSDTGMRSAAKALIDYTLGNPPITIDHTTGAGENTAVGIDAMRDATSGSDNTAVGARAMRDQTTPYYNTGIGHYALGFNTVGWKNTAVGCFAMKGVEGATEPNDNTAVGFRALNLLQGGQRNVAMGNDAMLQADDVDDNIAVGSQALYNNIADDNVAIGSGTLYEATTGGTNTAVGTQTGRGITTGTGNTILGANVGSLAAALTNNIILAIGTGAIKAQWSGTAWSFTGGASGSFTTTDGKTVTVSGGLVTAIV